MALARKSTAADVFRDKFRLTGSPFRVAEIYNPDNPGVYVREMYGKQLDEFHRKFFLDPLERDVRQTIGAVWSSHAGESEGRGFGKSMMMSEESKIANRDFGASILSQFDVTDEAIVDNPFLAAYCTFEQSKGIQTFPAALLEGVAFALRCDFGAESNVHQELRRRIAESLDANPSYEAEAIRRALMQKLGTYKNLSIQLSHRQVAGFIDALCSDDTETLAIFIREKIGPRIRAAQGFHFVHIFNAFASLAGIAHVVYFVDQIENFAKHARHQDRDVRILRESMCQTSPTADMASFVFQMHINALRVLEPIWNAEHLPSIDYSLARNKGRIVDLQGLRSVSEAAKVTEKLLAGKRPKGTKVPSPLHPFDKDGIELVLQASDGNPRRFLEMLDTLLSAARSSANGAIDKTGVLELTFVRSLVDDSASQYSAPAEEDEDDLSNPIQ
ncbi:hypothetical protein [Mesorhizobium sp. LNHC252B00]|uniref:hypothetical protein n=1 Tax=Mesorhizobium sp. LNHC252B00 TaxID=1287252 RepID=UPI0003FE9419|nr:hypothetical protein [Mesorhizobium sp. LNHC252B00]